MVKIPHSKIDLFVNAPDKNIVSTLIYGPDLGLISERVDKVTRAVVDDVSDPFRIADLFYSNIKEDPAILYDEIHAMCLTGGRRLIKVRDSGTTISKEIIDILSNHLQGTFVLFIAGELPPASNLRKTFEKEKHLAALPCYKDDQRSLQSIIEKSLRENQFSWDPGAISLLSNSFFGDRLVVNNELNKLMIYMGDNRHISEHDVRMCIDDNSEASLDQLCNAVGSLNAVNIDTSLHKALMEGVTPVHIIRALLRHFTRIHVVLGNMAKGEPMDQAMAKLKPPVFFKQVPLIKQQVRLWDEKKLRRALSGLIELEIECKKGLMSAEVLCARFLTIFPLAMKR